MGAQGTTTVNFGAFPGSTDATVTVTGQSGILSTSLAEAWIFPADTADHTADEHVLEPIKVFARDIVEGVGFTIHAVNDSQLFEPLEKVAASAFRPAATTVFGDSEPSVGGYAPLIYGEFKVAWVWN